MKTLFDFTPVGDYTTCCYSPFQAEIEVDCGYRIFCEDIIRTLCNEYGSDVARDFDINDDGITITVNFNAGCHDDCFAQTWKIRRATRTKKIQRKENDLLWI